MRLNTEKQCGRPLLLQNRRRKAMGKFFERKSSRRPESVWEEISKTVQKTTSVESARTHYVILDILPRVRRVRLYEQKRLAVSPTKKTKKTRGKGSVAILKNSMQSGCVFQDV